MSRLTPRDIALMSQDKILEIGEYIGSGNTRDVVKVGNYAVKIDLDEEFREQFGFYPNNKRENDNFITLRDRGYKDLVPEIYAYPDDYSILVCELVGIFGDTFTDEEISSKKLQEFIENNNRKRYNKILDIFCDTESFNFGYRKNKLVFLDFVDLNILRLDIENGLC